MKYIDADRLRAEIEGRIDILSKESVEEAKKGNFDMSHYCHGKDVALEELLSFLSTLESEKQINPEAAMKELDEKIALVKRRGTWDGVDVDKYMDEVRGRESEKPMNLEEEVKRYYSDNFAYLSSDQPTLSILTNIARHFAEWQKEQDEKEQADLFTIVAIDAAQRAKEQMMKEAVEGEYGYFSSTSKTILPSGKLNLKEGDKIRIIIVKEGEK